MKNTNKKITLVVLAGGMGSRYKGLKQTDGMGPSGESIMEYSIHDAINAGFNKIVFIVNEKFNNELRNLFISKINNYKSTEVFFVNQTLNAFLPKESILKIKDRLKPWGTGHALLVAKDIVKEPFVVINADDYYGQQSFVEMFKICSDFSSNDYAMMAYPIQNTLSENGFVSRGICKITKDGLLESIIEETNIRLEKNKIQVNNEMRNFIIPENTLVSMNFWCFQSSVFNHLESYFIDFINRCKDLNSEEFFLPFVINSMIQEKLCKVKVLSSIDCWFGITYPEDKLMVQHKIKELISLNKYPENLWS